MAASGDQGQDGGVAAPEPSPAPQPRAGVSCSGASPGAAQPSAEPSLRSCFKTDKQNTGVRAIKKNPDVSKAKGLQHGATFSAQPIVSGGGRPFPMPERFAWCRPVLYPTAQLIQLPPDKQQLV